MNLKYRAILSYCWNVLVRRGLRALRSGKFCWVSRGMFESIFIFRERPSRGHLPRPSGRYHLLYYFEAPYCFLKDSTRVYQIHIGCFCRFCTPGLNWSWSWIMNLPMALYWYHFLSLFSWVTSLT